MAGAPDLIVAGAGMAGMVAATQARQHGATVRVLEKGSRAGGSMLLSSGVIWRYREFDRFRSECPGGDPALQREVFDRLDRDLAWLESLGAPVADRETGNPATAGLRFDPAGLTRALLRGAGEVELGQPVRSLPAGIPLILATGGFQGDRALVRRHVTPYAKDVMLRAAPWSTGDGLRLGLEAGGRLTEGMDEFYGRNMPAPPARVSERDFVELAQLYARHATVRGRSGEQYRVRTWSEIDVVQWTARQPGARALYVVPESAREERVRDRTVGEMVDAARRAGAKVAEEDGSLVVEVVAGLTTTLGGLRIDPLARVADPVLACGADAGGIATGGYASGLASALVFGRIAADSALV